MEVVRVVQDPAHPLSDTPASFTGVLVEPFEVFVLNRYDHVAGVQGEIDRWMGTVVLRTESGVMEAEMAPQFELVGDWFFAEGVDTRAVCGTPAQLLRHHPRAMAQFEAPSSWWQRNGHLRYLWALTIPAGTEVRVERFDAYVELRPRGGYRTARRSIVRVHSHRLVVIVDDRRPALDVLGPPVPLPSELGLATPIVLAIPPIAALVCAAGGMAEPAQALAYFTPALMGLFGLLWGAAALNLKLARRRSARAMSEEPSGPPRLY